MLGVFGVFGWAGRLALKRVVAQWRSLLTVIAGVLLSASIGALIPLYTTAVGQVGMVERFNALPADTVNAHASFSLIPSQTPDNAGAIQTYQTKFHDIVDRYITSQFPGWLNQITFYSETSVLDLDSTDPTLTATAQAHVGYYDNWQSNVSLIAGQFPTDSADKDADIQIAVPLDAQTALGFNVGDILLLDQGGPNGGWPSSKNVRARITAIVGLPAQETLLSRAYFMSPSPLRVTTISGKTEFVALTTHATLDRVPTTFIPDTPTTSGWRLLFDHTRLPFSRSPEARRALFDLDQEMAGAFPGIQFHYGTGLINWGLLGGVSVDSGVMLDYENSVKSLDAPFGLLLLQIGALVIFFLLAMSSLVRRGERRETSMLQSRGATDSQIIFIRGAEAVLICIFGAAIGPFFGQQLLIFITPFFARYPNLPLLLSPLDFIYSTIAAISCFVILIFTLRPVLRLPLVAAGGISIRSESRQWWQRYYVDLLLVVPGIAALWRLAGRNTPLFTTGTGDRATDPLLLIAPVFLFLGLGSVLLRLFPRIAGFAARLLARGRALIAPLATWQLSRESVHYGQITFLLALTVGIGWFATSFRATLDRSQSDQAEYRVGTDIRFNERDTRLNAARARDAQVYAALPGVISATTAFRRPYVNFQPVSNAAPIAVQVLGIDSSTFAESIYWRPDLGTLNMPPKSTSFPDRGMALPFSPQKLSLWAQFRLPDGFGAESPDLDRLRNRTTIYVRLLDASGAWFRVPFKLIEVEYVSTGPQLPGAGGGGGFASDGWGYFEADLSTLNAKPVEPVHLSSIYWQYRGSQQSGGRDLMLILGNFSATNVQGVSQPLDLMLNSSWEYAYDSGAATSNARVATNANYDSRVGLSVMWDQSAGTSTMGLLLNYPELPALPLLISDSLNAQMRLQPGQELKIRALNQITFKLIGTQTYYPTLYDAQLHDGKRITDAQNYPFAITDRDSLLYMLNRQPGAALYADEVWLRTSPGANVDSIVAALPPSDRGSALLNIQTLPGALNTLQTDPLSLGLLGLMFLAFVIAMILSIVGLLTYSTLSANARRGEFGVLRALGLSSWKLTTQLAFEQLFVIGVGVLLGGALGGILSSQVVPRLAQDAAGKDITPPFIVQIETSALSQYALIMGIGLALVLLLSLVLISRLSISQTLRFGDE